MRKERQNTVKSKRKMKSKQGHMTVSKRQTERNSEREQEIDRHRERERERERDTEREREREREMFNCCEASEPTRNPCVVLSVQWRSNKT